MSVKALFFDVFGTLVVGTAARPNRLKFAAVRKSANGTKRTAATEARVLIGTHSGQDRNPAMQQSPGSRMPSKIQNN